MHRVGTAPVLAMPTPSPALPAKPRVAVVDDEQGVRGLIAGWLSKAGFQVAAFGSTDEFYRSVDPESVECIVMDYYFPNSLGTSIHEWVDSTNSVTSVVFVSGRVGVTGAVEAIKRGAVDFLEKPLTRERLLEVVGRAVRRTLDLREARRLDSHSAQRLASLSDRELEVSTQLTAGRASKEIARLLHISPRTVEHHRASLMKKLGVSSVAELGMLMGRAEAARSARGSPSSPEDRR